MQFVLAVFICGCYCVENSLQQQDAFSRQKDNTWFKDGVNLLNENINAKIWNRKAKGVILFVGDGMGMTTVTAARILDGQLKGNTGEENVLSWENYKHVALSKTYNVNQMVPDSAGTATAFMTGVKSRAGVISVNENTEYADCSSSKDNHVLSIIMMAEKAGLSTGVVTTARLTHATPSTAYSHSASRNWESDKGVPKGCKDIASQLIDFPYGDGLEIAMGGGRREFIPNTVKDHEANLFGRRQDSRNLIYEWGNKTTKEAKYEFVWNDSQFKKLNPNKVDHVLGLFNYDHMQYSYNRKSDTAGEPSISEMAEFAVKVLNKNPKGYVLLVEGGRIDHGHHANKAFHALHDALALNQAVELVNNITHPSETLTIVTADHSHVFTIAGSQSRGAPIFGYTDGLAKDGKKYTTLGYMNGPGAEINKARKEPTLEQLADPEYQWGSSLIPLRSETHGGEDVGIYARGCQSHMVRGVVEQNYIFHVMDYALCLSESKKEMCIQQGLIKAQEKSSSVSMWNKNMMLLVNMMILVVAILNKL